MGADSRATSGNIIADKNCMKVHYLTESIRACGAGTAADLDQVCIIFKFFSTLFFRFQTCCLPICVCKN